MQVLRHHTERVPMCELQEGDCLIINNYAFLIIKFFKDKVAAFNLDTNKMKMFDPNTEGRKVEITLKIKG